MRFSENVEMITGSVLAPVLESVAALPAYPAKMGQSIQPPSRDQSLLGDEVNIEEWDTCVKRIQLC